jgi:uncharacterized protein
MRLVEIVQSVMIAAVVGYALLAALITIKQRALIYNPDPRRTTPERSGLQGVEHLTIATLDGHSLVAWYAPASPGRPTLIYFHGNTGWIEMRSERLADLQARGFGVLMPSYRGYGGSTGQPSEAANISDAKLIYEALRARGVDGLDIIVMGESLGTGIATQLAAARIVAGLVLDSPYTSMRDLAQRDYPWLPIDWLLWDRYETSAHIKRVTVPVLVLHGEADVVVPVGMGLAVHGAVPGPKSLRTYRGRGHLGHREAGSFDDLDRWVHHLRRARRVGAVSQLSAEG